MTALSRKRSLDFLHFGYELGANLIVDPMNFVLHILDFMILIIDIDSPYLRKSIQP